MASTAASALSPDRKYWANLRDGRKLTIYDTSQNTFSVAEDFIQNSQESSFSSVLVWLSDATQLAGKNNASPSWKKHKRKSVSSAAEVSRTIAVGSSTGSIVLYDAESSRALKIFENGHTSRITALARSSSHGLFSAAEDNHIVEWNVADSSIVGKWKSGRVNALAVLSDRNSVIAADRKIKWWDSKTKMLLTTFGNDEAGHVSFLRTAKIAGESRTFVISGARDEADLRVWLLDEETIEGKIIGILAMPEIAMTVSVKILQDLRIGVVATGRSGQTYLFKYKPSRQSGKRFKPTLKIVVVAQDSVKKEISTEIPIQTAEWTDDDNLIIGYGATRVIAFETIAPNFTKKIQRLARPRVTGPTKLPEELDKLSLNNENLCRSLVQGLDNDDSIALSNLLANTDETVVAKTVSNFPANKIVQLMRQLTTRIRSNKLYISEPAEMWLSNLLRIHHAHLSSHPDKSMIAELIGQIMSAVAEKSQLRLVVTELRGRVALLIEQRSKLRNVTDEKNTKVEEEQQSLLVVQDADFSDEDVGEYVQESESNDDWEELSEQEEPENGRSDDDASICS